MSNLEILERAVALSSECYQDSTPKTWRPWEPHGTTEPAHSDLWQQFHNFQKTFKARAEIPFPRFPASCGICNWRVSQLTSFKRSFRSSLEGPDKPDLGEEPGNEHWVITLRKKRINWINWRLWTKGPDPIRRSPFHVPDHEPKPPAPVRQAKGKKHSTLESGRGCPTSEDWPVSPAEFIAETLHKQPEQDGNWSNLGTKSAVRNVRMLSLLGT